MLKPSRSDLPFKQTPMLCAKKISLVIQVPGGREPWSWWLREETQNKEVVSSIPTAGYWMDFFT